MPNAGELPYTGDYVDGFGNLLTVLAVANPHIPQAEWLAAYGHHGLGDRAAKEEGYGMLRVDVPGRRHVLEAWRWDVDPTAPGVPPDARMAVRAVLRRSLRDRRLLFGGAGATFSHNFGF